MGACFLAGAVGFNVLFIILFLPASYYNVGLCKWWCVCVLSLCFFVFYFVVSVVVGGGVAAGVFVSYVCVSLCFMLLVLFLRLEC